jgi:two-component system chemotaxis sensor kinase CheA
LTRLFSIPLKLLLLAGVPVAGALVLAALIVLDAQQQAKSTAALGSIEDLAHLSAQIGAVVEQLQFERNEAALKLVREQPASADIEARFAETDRAERQLMGFLANRKLAALPARLARDLEHAEKQLEGLRTVRDQVRAGKIELPELLEYYKATNRSLISATAALAQLSDDGELLRAISALVGVLEIKERASQEHAVLTHVFAAGTFPPGLYKELVTLTTEERDFVGMLELQASDSVFKRFRAEQRRPEAQRASELRKVALETLDENFGVDATEWSRIQSARIRGLRSLEVDLNEKVRQAALMKVAAAARAVHISYGVGAGIVVSSALLAFVIGRGISRSVGALSSTAQRVRVERDFSLRAEKTSDDELGALTDAFNEMLSGLKERDEELSRHRDHLEHLVDERTRALKQRNAAMRLVLDNVDQGLVTIERDGTLAMERSRAFHAWFGASIANEPFEQRIAGGDRDLQERMRVAWDQLLDGFMPLEVCIDQLPKRLEIRGRHYALDFKAIQDSGRDSNPQAGEPSFVGALLVVSDITAEIARMARDAEQREIIAMFERLTEDRNAFFQFIRECGGLVRSVLDHRGPDLTALMRAAHTLKGSAGSFGLNSLADAAHRLESAIAESGGLPPDPSQLAELEQAWHTFMGRAHKLAGSAETSVFEIAGEELDQLLEATARAVPHAEIRIRLEQLRNERVIVRLQRAADQARALARKLGKGEVEVEVRSPGDLRLPAETWAPFWGAFVHVLRNAVDHGLETPDERARTGKQGDGRMALTAAQDGRELVIELADDGRGIDWQRVRERAAARGLPHETEADLIEALFADGLTTRDAVTGTSGRGVGLGAVRQAARTLGGNVAVSSRPGKGSVFRFRFPISAARRDAVWRTPLTPRTVPIA